MQTTTIAKYEIFFNDKPNLVLVSRQIEGLREVIRRLKVSQPITLDSRTNEKLERLKNRYPVYS